MCPDDASSYVTTRSGARCLCAGCSLSWWSILCQPSIFAFYGVR
jgi:hypothetical protein